MIHDNTADTCEQGPFTGASVDLFFAVKMAGVMENLLFDNRIFLLEKHFHH